MRSTVHPATDRDLQVVARFVAAAQGAADSGALTLGALGEPPAPFRTSPLSASPVQGEWVRAQDCADGDQPPDGSGPADSGVVLYLHGRRFQFDEPAGVYAAPLALATRLPVLHLRYRLAPQHQFPAALEDVVEAYQVLLAGRPASQIVLAGHSAGATLVLSALQVLRDSGAPAPAGAVVLSPITDFTLSGPSLTANDGRDVINLAEARQVRSAYLGPASPAAAPQSPLAGDCAGLPPLLIACGEAELLRDDALRFAGRADASGVEVDLEQFEGMPHGFPVMPLEAAQVLLSRIIGFTARRLGGGGA
jgi:acetyl esterase/lipase